MLFTDPVPRNWLYGALTILGLFYVPLWLLNLVRRLRYRPDLAYRKEAKPAPGKWEILSSLLGASFIAVALWHLGTWHWISIFFWYISATARKAPIPGLGA